MENMRELVCNNFNRLFESSKFETYRELAAAIKVNENTIQRWVKKKSYPELPNIEKIAEKFDVSPLEFYRTPQELGRPISVSSVVPLLLSIPDHIYRKAHKIGPEHIAWKMIEGILDGAIKSIETKAKSDKQG